MWLVTIGRYLLQPEMQPKDVTLESVYRTCRAAEDLDSLTAIIGPDRGRVLLSGRTKKSASAETYAKGSTHVQGS
jgi:hypothetical protein